MIKVVSAGGGSTVGQIGKGVEGEEGGQSEVHPAYSAGYATRGMSIPFSREV